MTRDRTASAIASDINLLVEMGYIRDVTPPDQEDCIFYGKGKYTAIVFKTTNDEKHEDKGIFKRCDFTAEGMPVKREFVAPLPF